MIIKEKFSELLKKIDETDNTIQQWITDSVQVASLIKTKLAVNDIQEKYYSLSHDLLGNITLGVDLEGFETKTESLNFPNIPQLEILMLKSSYLKIAYTFPDKEKPGVNYDLESYAMDPQDFKGVDNYQTSLDNVLGGYLDYCINLLRKHPGGIQIKAFSK